MVRNGVAEAIILAVSNRPIQLGKTITRNVGLDDSMHQHSLILFSSQVSSLSSLLENMHVFKFVHALAYKGQGASKYELE